jgi:hypothetical protein
MPQSMSMDFHSGTVRCPAKEGLSGFVRNALILFMLFSMDDVVLAKVLFLNILTILEADKNQHCNGVHNSEWIHNLSF